MSQTVEVDFKIRGFLEADGSLGNVTNRTITAMKTFRISKKERLMTSGNPLAAIKRNVPGCKSYYLLMFTPQGDSSNSTLRVRVAQFRACVHEAIRLR